MASAGRQAPCGGWPVLDLLPLLLPGFRDRFAEGRSDLYAQYKMGESWRMGVDDSATTTLVTTSVFALVRNPIFTAMLVFASGATLLIPNVVSIIGFVLLLTAIELQVRVVEEPYLMRVHADDYRQYARRVGRFVPGVGSIR